MELAKKFGLTLLSSRAVGGIDRLIIFSSDSDLYEWLADIIEKTYPFKKKEMLEKYLILDFKKLKGGWNDPAYACGMALDDSVLLLLDNGWEPFQVDINSETKKYYFRKEY